MDRLAESAGEGLGQRLLDVALHHGNETLLGHRGTDRGHQAEGRFRVLDSPVGHHRHVPALPVGDCGRGVLQSPFHLIARELHQAAGVPAVDAQFQEQIEACLVNPIRQPVVGRDDLFRVVPDAVLLDHLVGDPPHLQVKLLFPEQGTALAAFDHVPEANHFSSSLLFSCIRCLATSTASTAVSP